jgi:hypothetical protein
MNGFSGYAFCGLLTPPAQGAALKPVPDRSYGTADELLVDLRRI